MTVALREVQNRKDLKKFITFPFELYRKNRYWIPPLLMDEWHTLDSRKNPAFKHCRTRFFLAEKDGRLAGRILGIINEEFIKKWGDRYCRFGWFDFVDDREVSEALLRAVEEWAAAERMEAVHGPLGFTDLDGEGMLVEGFEELGTMATLYNYPYYPEHIEALGYRKDADWVEFHIKVPQELPAKVLRLQDLVLKRSGLRIVQAKKKELLPYAAEIFELINEAYADLYGFVPLTDEQVEAYVKQYFSFLNPDYISVVTDRENRVAAFMVAMPSLSRALQRARGRILPFGFIHVLRGLFFPRQIDFLLVAVRREYRFRGIPVAMITEIAKNALKNGIQSVETNIQLETNTGVLATWKQYPARQHKRRRCYIKTLP